MLKNNRLFSCKYEELLPVSKFTLYSLKRDIAEFSAFSTQFSEEYVTQTEAMITTVENLLEPQAETLALKMMTLNAEKQYVELQKTLLQMEGYLKLMINGSGITTSAFGLTTLRRSLNKGDIEAILKDLKVLTSNVQNQLTPLQAKGMPQAMPQTLLDMHNSLAATRQKQLEIKSNRAAIVQNNMKTLNDLYLRMSEIYNIGKVLYKNTDPAKYADYTFTTLLRKVRNSPKSSATDTATVVPEQIAVNN